MYILLYQVHFHLFYHNSKWTCLNSITRIYKGGRSVNPFLSSKFSHATTTCKTFGNCIWESTSHREHGLKLSLKQDGRHVSNFFWVRVDNWALTFALSTACKIIQRAIALYETAKLITLHFNLKGCYDSTRIYSIQNSCLSLAQDWFNLRWVTLLHSNIAK